MARSKAAKHSQAKGNTDKYTVDDLERELNLAFTKADKEARALKKKLASPPDNEHKPACYWFWQHIPSKAEINAQLEDMQEHGFGLVMPAARLSLPREQYLSEAYLKAWQHCARKAQKLGLTLGIYDDYNWVSGQAAGRTVALDDLARESQIFFTAVPCNQGQDAGNSAACEGAGCLELKVNQIVSPDADCLEYVGQEWTYEGAHPLWDNWQIVGLYALSPAAAADNQGCRITDLTSKIAAGDFSADETGCVLRLKTQVLPEGCSAVVLFVSARCKSSRMINYLRRQSAESFIQAGYEPYAAYLAPYFGKTISMMFFDQPHSCFYSWAQNDVATCLQTGGDGGDCGVNAGLKVAPYALRSSLMYSAELLDKLGSDRAKYLCSLLFELGPDSVRWRCGFFEIYKDLALRNFFEPLKAWCQRHNLLLSGHEVLGHVGSWSLTDKVICEDNRVNFGMDYFALDAYRDVTAVDAKNSRAQLSAKMGDSVARAHGRSGCILEQYYGNTEPGVHFAAGKWELKPHELYRQITRHHLLGMRQFLMHAYYVEDGSAGNTEVFTNPRFDFAPGINFEPWYHSAFPYLARHSASLSSFLELGDPVLDFAVLYPRRDLYALGVDDKRGKLCAGLFRYLSENAFDYLLLDEDCLSGAKVRDGKLKHEKSRFNALLLPDVKTVKCAKTLRKLTDFARQGLPVMILGGLPSLSASQGEDAELLAAGKELLSESAVSFLPLPQEGGDAALEQWFASACQGIVGKRLHLSFGSKAVRGISLCPEEGGEQGGVYARLQERKGVYLLVVFNDAAKPLDFTLHGAQGDVRPFEVIRMVPQPQSQVFADPFAFYDDDNQRPRLFSAVLSRGNLGQEQSCPLRLEGYEIGYYVIGMGALPVTVNLDGKWQLAWQPELKEHPAACANPDKWKECGEVTIGKRGQQPADLLPADYCGPLRYTICFDSAKVPGWQNLCEFYPQLLLKVSCHGALSCKLNDIEVCCAPLAEQYLDLSDLLVKGENELELTVYPAAANHYYHNTGFRAEPEPVGLAAVPVFYARGMDLRII